MGFCGRNVYIQKEVHQLRPAFNCGFGVNIFHMGFNGVFAHMQFTGNHPIGFDLDEKICNLTLALCEIFCDNPQISRVCSWAGISQTVVK